MSDVTSATPGGPAGTIHDLGYKRYAGTRRAQATRWRVIARNQAATTWRTFFRFKAWFLLAIAITTGFIVFLTFEPLRVSLRNASDFTAQAVEDIIVAFPMQFLPFVGFVATLTASAGTIAGDHQSGAFTFYFARPVRPIDYVIGKVAGLFAMFSLIFVVGPVVVAAVRVGTAGGVGEVVGHLHIVGRMLVVGVLAALAYATVPLAFSALVPTRRYALALWAAYYLVVGTIAAVIAAETSARWIGALDIAAAVKSLAFEILDVKLLKSNEIIPLPSAVAGILAQSAAAIAIVFLRLRAARAGGVGGSS